MIVGSITRRYAKALFDLAVEQGKVEAWSEALQSLKRAVDASDELRDVLVNPMYTREQRRAIGQKLGRLRARVTSAVPLDGASAQAIADRLARATRAQVIVERDVDPSLVGGVVAQVGSFTFDSSVRTQLEDLRRTLKQ